ncbi:MAG: hypothetical protein ACRBN8_19660 [Nannocystales bacterium]
MTTTKTTKKDLPGKSKKGLWALAIGGGAVAAGLGAFFFTRDAKADEGSGKKSKGAGTGGGKKSAGKRSGGGGKKKSGGSSGPGGNDRGGSGSGDSSEPTEDTDETPEVKSDREGYFWGDPQKIPEDFDYGSNQIYVSPDCSTVAVGYWFFAEGTDTKTGKSTRVSMSKLVDAISKDSDPKVRPPRPDFNGIGAQADLLGILTEHPKRTAFTWVGEYYGGVVSAPNHSSTQLAEDLLRQASMRTGGNDCVARRDLWSPGMWDFIGFAATRLDEFRMAAYGPQAFGG